MLEKECKEEFGLVRVRNLVFWGSGKTIYSRWRQERKKRNVFDFRDTPRLIHRPNYVNYLGLLYHYTRG